MRGVVFLGDRQLELMEFPDPTPGEGEVVLEMKASGMCGSDLHQYRRAKGGESIGGLPVATEPVIAGHEPCGIVAAVGPGVPEVQAKSASASWCITTRAAPCATIAAPAGRNCARKCRSRYTATTPMAGTPNT